MNTTPALHLLNQIANSQTINTNFFQTGLIPSYRYNRYWLYRRADPNLFFTTISAFTLQRLLPHCRPNEAAVAHRIIEAAIGTYSAFRSRDKLHGEPQPTYNFYANVPNGHFPNGLLMHRFRHFMLPDDIDDTAMVYLTTQPTAADLDFLHRKLAQHANRARRTIQNTFADYRDLRAYSTWFGQQMPIEFDACALANMLYCVYEYNLPIDVPAQDSLALLASMIETNRCRTDPFRCAHNYATAPLIAYHIARLIAAHNPAPLRPVRTQLIADMWAMLGQTNSRMEQVLLGTSLRRLGEKPPQINLEGIEREFDTFSFFIAGMLSAYEQPLLRRLAPHPFWHIRWHCPDHCRVLLVEYLVSERVIGEE
jgi:hypothetical protein